MVVFEVALHVSNDELQEEDSLLSLLMGVTKHRRIAILMSRYSCVDVTYESVRITMVSDVMFSRHCC